MSDLRRPAAFRVEPELSEAPAMIREPRALDPAGVLAETGDIDPIAETITVIAPRRRSWAGTLLAGALGVLVSLALGLWADALIRDLFSRVEWLGWFAAGVAAVAALALLVVIARELRAVLRLASLEALRRQAQQAFAADDPKAARLVAAELAALFASRPEAAAGRRAVADLNDEVVDGVDILRIAEAELLGPLDARARALVLDAAKRVSVVTAVSPRAVVDLAYVAFESARLIRRLSVLYGGRPGTLGFWRLARRVLSHLALTGVIAAGDEVVHQLVGQGLAARLSAKLGEGVVNGMMTARIGIAAIEAARPLPFIAAKRPRIADFLSVLTAFAGRAGRGGGATP